MIGQWARLFTQLTTFRTMTCFGESNGSRVDHNGPKTSVKIGGFEAKDCAFAL
jgi:hypothetical protein